MHTNNNKLRWIAEAGIIAALYVVLTMLVAPIASGPIQFRVSEALMVLPALFPSSIVGITIGVLISNAFTTGLGMLDIVFGTLATLLAAIFTFLIAKHFRIGFDKKGHIHQTRMDIWKSKRTYLIPLPAIIFNMLIVGSYLPILYPNTDVSWIGYAILISILQLAISEAVVVYLIGLPFYVGIYPYFIKRFEQDVFSGQTKMIENESGGR